jgi:hypothetical protein
VPKKIIKKAVKKSAKEIETFIKGMDNVSKETADRIRTGKIKIKSSNPKIQESLDEKFPSLRPVKKMAGGGIAIKGHGKAFTGNK